MTHTTFVATEPTQTQSPTGLLGFVTKEHQLSPVTAIVILALFATAVFMGTSTRW